MRRRGLIWRSDSRPAGMGSKVTGTKVLILGSTFPRWQDDNQPQFVLDFAQHLAQNHAVTVLAPYEKGSRIHERLGAVEVYRFPYAWPGTEKLAYRGGMVNTFRSSASAKVQLPLFLLGELVFGLYLVAAKRIDVLNAHWLFPQGFVASAIKKISRRKLVITTHGGDVEILKRPEAKRLLEWPLKTADAVTFVSRRNLAMADEHTTLPSDSWSVMPMGIDPPTNQPMGIDPPTNHQGRERSTMNVLFLGRLVEIKGVAYLIQGVAKANEEGLGCHLNILGDGPSRQQLTQLVADLHSTESITFCGFIGGQSKDKYLADCDIVVIPSITDDQGHEEGLPVTALEAMAYGKVLIATRTGSMPELLEGGGGILIEQKDARAICSAIKHIAASPDEAARIGEAARRKAKDYDWTEIIRRFDLILDHI
ncbi:MAG: glycosyltransferase [Actinomycetota bacterium]